MYHTLMLLSSIDITQGRCPCLTYGDKQTLMTPSMTLMTLMPQKCGLLLIVGAHNTLAFHSWMMKMMMVMKGMRIWLKV